MSRTVIVAPDDELIHVRKVYAWLLVGVGLCCGAAWVALNTGTPVETVFDKHTVTVPPLVASMLEHPITASILFLGLAIAAAIARKAQALMAPLFIFFTAFSGVFIAPMLFIAQMSASEGGTISGHPLRDAAILTLFTFTGLTAFVFLSKHDFSAWRSFLTTGLWVLIGAMVLSIFFGSHTLNLAISSVGVLLFAGFMVFDTWRILQDSDRDSPIADALNLFLDLLNMFLHLVRIFASKK